MHGTAAYAEAIDKAVTLARLTAEEIHRRDHLELIREPDLSIVLFRRDGWKSEDYHRWAQELHHDDVAFIPPSRWEGETVGRFAFLHPHTTMDLVWRDPRPYGLTARSGHTIARSGRSRRC